jgi:hypothetical protein
MSKPIAIPPKNPSLAKSGCRAHGFCERSSPQWYDSTLHYGLANIADPVNLSFGLLSAPTLKRQHIPFHLQQGASLEAAIVAEKVVKNMNSIREARLRSASSTSDSKESSGHFAPPSVTSGSAEWAVTPNHCSVDTGMALWSDAIKTPESKNASDSTGIQGLGIKCKCIALKLLKACENCGSHQACRSPIDTNSDDEIDRAFELIKLRRENMLPGVTPLFSFRRKASAARPTHAGTPRHVLFGKFSPGK